MYEYTAFLMDIIFRHSVRCWHAPVKVQYELYERLSASTGLNYLVGPKGFPCICPYDEAPLNTGAH